MLKAASNYFNDTDIAVEGIDNITKADFEDYKPTLCGCTMALEMDSGTAIRIFTNAETASYQENSYTVTTLTKKPGGYFEFVNIPALYLNSDYEMYIGDDVLTFSALSYGYLAMQLDPDDPANAALKVGDLQALVRALLVYAEATAEAM